MGTISRQYTFVAGAVPTADNWNADWSQMLTLVNGQLDKGNVDSSSSDGICTLDENQTITGVKTFTTAQVFNNGITINEGSNDSDTRIETNNMANAVVIDAGLDCISFGAAAVDDSFVQIAKGATTSSATQNTYHLNVAPGGATTIPSGTTAYAGSVNINEPNLTATGTITNAFSLRVAGAPTEGGTTNYALWIDSGATQLDGTLTVGVDDTGADVKFFGASAGAYLLYDESADTLDVRGATAAGAGKLKLTTGELTVVDGDILGRIDFQAPLESDGTDAVLVGASIWAEADDTFGTALNDTDLVFAVAESETAAERMRLSYDGTNVALAFTGGDLTITSGGGDISFDNENLTTTGTLASGNLGVTGTITGSGVLSIDDATDSTSGTSGSVHTDGGLGVAKNVYISEELHLLDSKAIKFGTGEDATISYDGTDLTIAPAAVGSGDLIVSGASIEFDDSEGVTLGTGKDATIQFNATNTVITTAAQLVLTPTTDTIFSNGTGVVIGHTAQVTANLGAMEFQVLGTGSVDSSMILGRWSDDNGDPSLLFIKSRDAAIADGSFDAVENNDALGLIRYMVDDGNDYNTAAVQTRAEVDDGSPIENQVGGAYVISTATTGGVMTEAMRIDSSQRTIVSGYSALQGSASANAGELRFGHTGRAKIQYGNSAEILSIESQGSSSSYGTIKFMTGGTPSEAMRIDNAGNVGIGTTSPDAHLEVEGSGDQAIMVHSSDNNDAGLTLKRTSGYDVKIVNGSGDLKIFGGNDTATAELMRVDANGGTYIGDSANGNMTVGLTVNMGPHDGQIVALKETGVNTGLTSATTFNVEIDDFLTINKGHATRGGTVIQSMALDGTGNSSLQIVGFGGTANTTKTTSGAGLVSIQAYEHDGSNALADTTANGTVFSVTTRKSSAAAAVFLVDEDGDLFADGSATTVYDEHDDVALLSAFDRNLSLEGAKGYIAADWEKTLAENEQSLIDLDILGGPRVGVPVKERGLINYTGLARLHNSAIRQVYGQLVDTMKRLEIAESRIALLTA